MSLLTRETFFSPVALERDEVEVPGLGGSVYVRAMTAGERDRFELAHTRNGGRDFRARLAAATVCDASGTLLFAEADVAALALLPTRALEPIVTTAVRLNRLSEAEVEGLAKN